MSGPLIFVLQAIGGLMMLFGFGSGDVAIGAIGTVLLVIGGLGFRSKTRHNPSEESRDNSNASELVSVLKEQNELLKRQLEKK